MISFGTLTSSLHRNSVAKGRLVTAASLKSALKRTP
jgi:hypothetical protein